MENNSTYQQDHINSNTTLVKVKLMSFYGIQKLTCNSNTTLVKVKLILAIRISSSFFIQIQHLLKLNASKINTFINNYSL